MSDDIIVRLKAVEAAEMDVANSCDLPPNLTANWEYAMAVRDGIAELAALRARVDLLRADRDLWMQRCIAMGWPTPEHAAAARERAERESARASGNKPAVLDLERVEIHRCTRCGALPRPTLMGRTVCPNCQIDVPQGLPTSAGEDSNAQ